jgi:hypothetical protein
MAVRISTSMPVCIVLRVDRDHLHVMIRHKVSDV